MHLRASPRPGSANSAHRQPTNFRISRQQSPSVISVFGASPNGRIYPFRLILAIHRSVSTTEPTGSPSPAGPHAISRIPSTSRSFSQARNRPFTRRYISVLLRWSLCLIGPLGTTSHESAFAECFVGLMPIFTRAIPGSRSPPPGTPRRCRAPSRDGRIGTVPSPAPRHERPEDRYRHRRHGGGGEHGNLATPTPEGPPRKSTRMPRRAAESSRDPPASRPRPGAWRLPAGGARA